MKKITILAVVAILAGLLAVPAVAEAGAAQRTEISGTTGFDFASIVPGEVRVTPDGVIHEFGGSAVLWMHGDLEGTVTARYQHQVISADGTHMQAQAFGEGTVTWNGRTGPVTVVYTPQCWALVPFEVFHCSGMNVMHGSGDLEGVTFRSTWGGLFPSMEGFTYQGFALDTSG